MIIGRVKRAELGSARSGGMSSGYARRGRTRRSVAEFHAALRNKILKFCPYCVI
jgi:predicted DNA-binding helix-hairpin-helix protein